MGHRGHDPVPRRFWSDDDINGRRNANPARLREFRRVPAAAFKSILRALRAALLSGLHRDAPGLPSRPCSAVGAWTGRRRGVARHALRERRCKKTYGSLGFDTLGTETVQVEGEEDKF
ncbi:hypothetical protein K438DRAFT_1980099 [Mycena galopus ATCC 62051]|nr:hypothetical protein K438DRAFT_1980099 [Mycena galopus ATCC 62051]